MKWILPCLFIGLFFLNDLHASTPQIRLCYEDVNVYPWITGDEKGLALTELKIAEKILGIEFKYVRLPWKRCQIQAKAGQVEGLIAASYNKERTEWATYPMGADDKVDREYRTHIDSFYVYVRKDSHIIWNDSGFHNLNQDLVGVQLGYSVGSDLKEQGYPTHSSFTTPYDLLKALDSGMLKVAVLQNHASLKVLRDNPKLDKNIIRQETPFKVADQYVIFNTVFYKKNSDLCVKIWKALAQARKSPEYLKAEQAFVKESMTFKKSGSASL